MVKQNIASIGSALIVGGGIGGMAAAICLAERGVAVELIDIDPEWRVYGAGITITGVTLRAYKHLGLTSPARMTTPQFELFDTAPGESLGAEPAGPPDAAAAAKTGTG